MIFPASKRLSCVKVVLTFERQVYIWFMIVPKWQMVQDHEIISPVVETLNEFLKFLIVRHKYPIVVESVSKKKLFGVPTCDIIYIYIYISKISISESL